MSYISWKGRIRLTATGNESGSFQPACLADYLLSKTDGNVRYKILAILNLQYERISVLCVCQISQSPSSQISRNLGRKPTCECTATRELERCNVSLRSPAALQYNSRDNPSRAIPYEHCSTVHCFISISTAIILNIFNHKHEENPFCCCLNLISFLLISSHLISSDSSIFNLSCKPSKSTNLKVFTQ